MSPHVERRQFEFTGFDHWMREADEVIHRSQPLLDPLAPAGKAGLRGYPD